MNVSWFTPSGQYQRILQIHDMNIIPHIILWVMDYYNMIVWILAGNYISFTIAAGLIRLHLPGVKKSHV